MWRVMMLGVGIVATNAVSASAQDRAAEPPGMFAVGVSAGPSIFAGDTVAVQRFGPAASVEAALTADYFVRVQYATAPTHRLTAGVAHAFARINRRAFLSSELGIGRFAGRPGAYAGAGLQAPLGRSPLVFTGDLRAYLTRLDRGIAAFAGVKLHIN